MRISDWSSDVCSSDLQWDVVAALAEEFFSGEGARSIGRTVFAVGDLKQSIFSFQRADPEAFRRLRRHFNERVAAADAEWREIELEIGRAAGRERVCQYVSHSVVAGTLKKKKKK